MKHLFVVLIAGILLSAYGIAADSHTLNNKEVAQLIAKASTPTDHLRLAQHYRLAADRLEAESKEHAEMAQAYRNHPTASETKRPGASDTVSHCQKLSENLAKAASESRALAAEHEKMAKK